MLLMNFHFEKKLTAFVPNNFFWFLRCNAGCGGYPRFVRSPAVLGEDTTKKLTPV